MAIRRYYPSTTFGPNTTNFKETVSVDRWDSPSLKLIPNRIAKRLSEYPYYFRDSKPIVPFPDMPTMDSQPRVVQGRLVNYIGQSGVIFISSGKVFNLPLLGVG